MLLHFGLVEAIQDLVITPNPLHYAHLAQCEDSMISGRECNEPLTAFWSWNITVPMSRSAVFFRLAAQQ